MASTYIVRRRKKVFIFVFIQYILNCKWFFQCLVHNEIVINLIPNRNFSINCSNSANHTPLTDPQFNITNKCSIYCIFEFKSVSLRNLPCLRNRKLGWLVIGNICK